jgi:hypothetical protein
VITGLRVRRTSAAQCASEADAGLQLHGLRGFFSTAKQPYRNIAGYASSISAKDQLEICILLPE